MRKAGASYSVVIPKALLDLLKIDPEKNLINIELEGKKIILTKGSSFES